MPIVFKLVGNVNSKVLEIKRDVTGIVRLSNIISMFEIYGLSSDDFQQIRFVANSETLKDNDKFFSVGTDDNLVVFVFSAHKETREKLAVVFLKNATNIQEKPSHESSEGPLVATRPLIGTVQDTNVLNRFTKEETVDEELQKPVVDKEVEVTPELSEEVINEMNKKTSKLFADKDFCNLVKIYYSKPELIKTFLSFVSHGDIININIPILGEKKDYSESIMMLRSLGITESDEVLTDALEAFNGHLNLTLRALLCEKAILLA